MDLVLASFSPWGYRQSLCHQGPVGAVASHDHCVWKQVARSEFLEGGRRQGTTPTSAEVVFESLGCATVALHVQCCLRLWPDATLVVQSYSLSRSEVSWTFGLRRRKHLVKE